MTSLARFATALAALSLLGLGCDGPLPTQRDAGVDAGLDLDARVFPDGTVFCETDADCQGKGLTSRCSPGVQTGLKFCAL